MTAEDSKSPNSRKTEKDAIYNKEVMIIAEPCASEVISIADEYGKTSLSSRLKAKKDKKINAYFTTDKKSIRLINVFKI